MNLGNPNENHSHSFQGIQHHYNTILTKSQVIYLPLFRYFSAISLDFPCRICHNNYVIMKKRENMNKLKVNMNYKTGRKGENNCRIVSAGSELDKMYEKAYNEYMVSQIDSSLGFTEQEQIAIERKEEQIQRDGSGEWILS